MTTTFNEVIKAIEEERNYQDNKWGTIEEHPQSIPGYLTILELELNEAKLGWAKNETGRNSVLNEICQIAAVAIACLQQHGIQKND